MERQVSTQLDRSTSLVYRQFDDKCRHWGWMNGCMKKKLNFSLRQYTTTFQAEVYAIKACAVENLHRGHRNRNTYILSDGQAATKAFDNDQINSKLVWAAINPL
jgi:hypothetical protein